jgi:acetolactate synthase-1/2/3 large subunit
VHLDFARDTIEGVVADPPAIPETHPVRGWVGRRPQPNALAVAEAAERLLAAQRPVIWLGNGGNRGRSAEAVLAFAESLNIPVVTTFNGIGSVPTTHPLVFGAVSRMGTTLSTRVLGGADLVLALGNSLNAVSTTRWKRRLPEVIQVDVDPAMIGRYYGEITTGIVSDIASFTEAMSVAIGDRGGAPRRAREAWVAELHEAERAWWESTEVAEGAHLAPLSPADIVRALREVAPDDTLLIPDAGNPGVWSFLWQIRQTNTYIKPVGFGNMGFALPSAIAASTIDPQRPVLALIGDGSLGMSLGELETLARVGGRVCLVVLNDASYGNIRQEQELHFNGRTIGVDFAPVDFGAVARGMGIAGEVVPDLATLTRRVSEALTGAEGPVLLDVPLDRGANAWTHHAFVPYEPGEE